MSKSEGPRLGKTNFFSRNTKRSTGISKDEKLRFFEKGILPKFKGIKSEKILQKKNASIDNELFPEAMRILNKVRDQFGNDGRFIEMAYGKRISANRASEVIHNYLVEHGIDGMMSVYFSTELDCSGKMSWTGPLNKYNLPEKRNYSMWVKNTLDNMYLRETGILSLSNHEIGTHFLRSFNDGLQPWYANRSLFGIGPYKSQALKDTEEGFASINTTFEAKVKYLWGPAILYYTACMSLKMNFKDLFEDLTKFVADPEVRWKYVFRVKRGHKPLQLGGNGKDQCYFRGAMHILTNMDSIDFNLLYAGKITVEDQHRVQRLARLGCVKMPYFLKDMQNYKRHLRSLIKLNEISKPKTAIVKQPKIKVTLPKSFEYEKKYSSSPTKKKAEKEVKNLVAESRKRIMQYLEKPPEAFLPVSETLDENCDQESSNTLSSSVEIEDCHNAKNYSTNSLDDQLLSHSELDISLPSPILVREAQAKSKLSCEKSPTLYFTNRRKSDTFCKSQFADIRTETEEIDAEEQSTSVDSTSPAIPQTARLFKPCNDSNFNSEVLNRSPYETDMVIVESNCSPILFSPDRTIQNVMTPSGKINPSLDTVARSNNTDIKMDQPKPTKLHKRHPAKRSCSQRALGPSVASNVRMPVKQATQISSEKVTRQQKNAEMSDASSTIRKNIKKKFTSFFDDLIPFSKSRRKRVLPLPNGK